MAGLLSVDRKCLPAPADESALRCARIAGCFPRFDETKRGGNHAFWPDDVSITNTTLFDWSRLQGQQQVTDVYLLALAVAHGGRFVTFDQRIQSGMVKGCRPEHLVTLREGA